MENDKISIIVPVYNVERYLYRCLDSILSQNYSNLEIILVDDGSTDKSGEIIDSYAEKDSRVVVIHKENGGLSSARNAGIDIATGEYIGFVDSDDWITSNMYSMLYNKITKYGADLSICGYCLVKNDKFEFTPNIEEMCLDKNKALELLVNDDIIHSYAWNKLYKRELFNTIRFPEGRLFEDIYIMHNIFLQSEKIVVLNDFGYYYFQRTDSIVNCNSLDNAIEWLQALLKRYDDLIDDYKEYAVIALKAAIILTLQTYKRLPEIKMSKEQISKFIMLLDSKRNFLKSEYRRNKELISFVRIDRVSFYVYLKLGEKYIHFLRIYLMMSKIFRFNKIKGILRKIYNISKLNRKEKTAEINIPETIKERVFLIGTPEYGNLGDQAIAYSEIKFLKEKINKTIIEIAENDYFKNLKRLKKQIHKNDIILLQGGGNLGSQYIYQEDLRESVITNFTCNKIIIFPQSADFTKGENAKHLLEKDQLLYSKSKNVIIFTREKYSYNFMKKYFPENHIELCPDIVMYLNESMDGGCRDGALLCLRNDVESKMDISMLAKIKDICVHKFSEVTLIDTCISKSISSIDRYREINKKLNEFRKAKIVITDRLHGVIFAAITSTPCIAFGNYNHKIIGIYEWMRGLKYISYCEDIEQLSKLIDDVTSCKTAYSNSTYMKFYNKLIEKIGVD